MTVQLTETPEPNVTQTHTSLTPLQKLLAETIGGDTDKVSRTTTTTKRDQPFKPIQRLPNNVKRFIVICIANGHSPMEVAWAVKDDFGLSITSSHVERYDPTKVSGQTLREEFKELFWQVKREREAALLKTGISHQTTRLVMLNEMFLKALDKGDLRTATTILASVAREMGGQYVKTPKLPDDKEQRRQLAALLLGCHPDDIPNIPPRPQSELPEN